MKKSLFLVPFMLGSLTMAADLSSLAFFDFNSSCLTSGTSATEISLTVSDVKVTVSTSYSGGLGSGTSAYNLSDDSIASLNANVGLSSENGFSDANSQTYLSAGTKSASADLTITLSGLEAGSVYNVSFVSGLDHEGAGEWTSVSSTNTYESINTNLVNTWALTAFNVVGIIADESGNITFSVDSKGNHSAVINSMAVALQNVPEPATASLSLLALGALALRRRRQ